MQPSAAFSRGWPPASPCRAGRQRARRRGVSHTSALPSAPDCARSMKQSVLRGGGSERAASEDADGVQGTGAALAGGSRRALRPTRRAKRASLLAACSSSGQRRHQQRVRTSATPSSQRAPGRPAAELLGSAPPPPRTCPNRLVLKAAPPQRRTPAQQTRSSARSARHEAARRACTWHISALQGPAFPWAHRSLSPTTTRSHPT